MAKKNPYHYIRYYHPTQQTVLEVNALMERGNQEGRSKAFCLLLEDDVAWTSKMKKRGPWGTWRKGKRDY